MTVTLVLEVGPLVRRCGCSLRLSRDIAGERASLFAVIQCRAPLLPPD
jgi:hypothetical protein